MTFSTTLISANGFRFWNERATPSRAITWGTIPVISSPFRNTLPLLGRQLPVMALKKVVFPAPFGPMTERISPSLTWMETPVSAFSPPNSTERFSVVRMSFCGIFFVFHFQGYGPAAEYPVRAENHERYHHPAENKHP